MYLNNYYTQTNLLPQPPVENNLILYGDYQSQFNTKPRNILINPKFKQSKIFVNPAFYKNQNQQERKIEINRVPLTNTQIYVNPKPTTEVPVTRPRTLHINPNFKSKLNDTDKTKKNELIVLSKTKLIRKPPITPSNSLEKSTPKQTVPDQTMSRFKIDRTRKKSLNSNNKTKCIFKNRFITMTDLSKNMVVKKTTSNLIKSTNLINISGIMYKKSKTSLKRTSAVSPKRTKVMEKETSANNSKNLSLVNINGIMYKKSKSSLRRTSTASKRNCGNVHATRYKLLQKHTKISEAVNTTRIKKISNVKPMLSRKSTTTSKKKPPPKKFKICNIPCSVYRKYGTCPGKENGKCVKKHDPDQIALCTKFLQGACIKTNCPLSHNVSEEKMPTCKFFLDGCCIKEPCPYLHVKLNPRTEICRDFVEGFCKKAAECDKRHQYLCPDYEKYGNCPKQRCPYPHGKMVRPYLINKKNFTKNYSTTKKATKIVQTISQIDGNQNTKKIENSIERPRYYDDSVVSNQHLDIEMENDELNEKKFTSSKIGLLNRPKLGILPSFIPFADSSVEKE